MKRIICISLSMMLVFLLVGCSCDKQSESKTEKQTETVNWEKGESLYGSKIREFVNACKDKKGADKMSKLTTGLQEVSKEKDLLKKIGYTFVDLDGDGTEELLISLINKKDKMDNYIIAAYTYTGDGIKRMVEGYARNTYYLVNNNYLLNEASGSADDAEIAKIHMRDLSFEIMSMLSMKYGKKDKINYLYAEVGKPKNTKEFMISEKEWKNKVKAWESEIRTDKVKPIGEFK